MATGDLYVPATTEEAAQDFRDDIEVEGVGLGITNMPVQKGTDWWIMSRALGQVAIRVFAKTQDAEANSSHLDATGVPLDKIRKATGLSAVVETAATGRIVPDKISGTRTVVNNEPFTISGVRYKADGTQSGLTQGSEIDVVSVDLGTVANQEADTIGEFDNLQLGISKSFKVSKSVPLVGGKDTETDARKRERILNRVRFTPSGGNPGHLREIAFNSSATVDECAVFPAIGGPSSVKVVALKATDPDNNDFSRELDTTALNRVRSQIQAEMPREVEAVVTTGADESTDVAVIVDIPDSALSGGNGTGWIDETPWPITDTGGSGAGYDYVSVKSITDSTRFVINAETLTSPIAAVTNLAWWSSNTQTFHVALVTVLNVDTPGDYEVSVDVPLVDGDDNTIAAGDFICPAAANLEAYAVTFTKAMATLSTGENTDDTYRLPRAERFPAVSDGGQASDLTARVAKSLTDDHDEVESVEYSHRGTTTPTVPVSVDAEPNVLVLRHFGVYPTE